MAFLTVVLIAISLSMDAFSLSLAYGTLNLDKKRIYLLSFIVGIYHFVMPLIGLLLGSFIINLVSIKTDILVSCILFLIGIEMIIETFRQKDNMNIKSFVQLLIFGLAVSIDSFSVGIGLPSLKINSLICAFTFSFTSLSFTYLGLILGKKISNLVGSISTLFGGLTLIILGIIYLC